MLGYFKSNYHPLPKASKPRHLCDRVSSSRSSSGRRVAPPWPRRMACLRGWQEQIQCRCGVGLSSEREDDQDDVSSPHQVNDRMLGRLGNVGRCVLESRVSQAMWPNTDKRRLQMKSVTGGKPVRVDTSAFVTKHWETNMVKPGMLNIWYSAFQLRMVTHGAHNNNNMHIAHIQGFKHWAYWSGLSTDA